MFQKFAALFLTLLVGMQSAAASENAESNNYYALVIGISDYSDPDIVDLSTAFKWVRSCLQSSQNPEPPFPKFNVFSTL